MFSGAMVSYVHGHTISHLENKQSIFSCKDENWLSEANCDMIKKWLRGCDGDDQAVADFKKRHRKKLYKSGKVSQPKYCLDEHGTLYQMTSIRNSLQKREVVLTERAKEIIKTLHQQRRQGIRGD